MAKFWVGLLAVVVVFAGCATDDGQVAVSADGTFDSGSAQETGSEGRTEDAPVTQDETAVHSEPDVFLDVSNQSFFDPDVHITIRDEDETYVDASFPVEGQHHVVGYQLSLGTGTHRLIVTSDSGARSELSIDVRDDGPTHVFVMYWAEDGSAPSFTSDQSTEPFAYG